MPAAGGSLGRKEGAVRQVGQARQEEAALADDHDALHLHRPDALAGRADEKGAAPAGCAPAWEGVAHRPMSLMKGLHVGLLDGLLSPGGAAIILIGPGGVALHSAGIVISWFCGSGAKRSTSRDEVPRPERLRSQGRRAPRCACPGRPVMTGLVPSSGTSTAELPAVLKALRRTTWSRLFM